jgi:dolichyl-phosphate beta-glucosyltransferase
MENEIYLSMIVPIYNEARRLPMSLEKIRVFSESLSFSFEWIFVVEPSDDDSLTIIQDFCSKHKAAFVIGNKIHKGKGFAVQTGMLHAKGNWALFMDADLSTPLEEVHTFLKYVEQKPDTHVLIGDRKTKAANIVKSQGPVRLIMGKTLSALLQSLELTDLPDTQCGFKLFSRDVIRPLFSNLICMGFSFDIEVLARAKNLGLTVTSLPITWKNDRDSSVRVVRDTLKMIRDIVRIYANLKN